MGVDPGARMTRPSRSTALLALLRAHGIEAEAAYDLRKPVAHIDAGMLYAADGLVYHLPFRPGRGYIGSLVPKSPEARAYLNAAVVVEIPRIPYPQPGHWTILHIRQALEKK